MAKFLDTTGVSYHLTQLINNSQERLILISPFLKINDNIKQSLDDKNLLKIDIRIVYGKNELLPEENNWLKSKQSIRTSFCKNLHAKCYLSEKEAIITSMNLYEYSQVNNQEMGVHVTKDADSELYNDIYKEVQKLIRISDEITVSVEKVPSTDETKSKTERPAASSPRKAFTTNGESGHCIRCNKEVQLNFEAPYCRGCWSEWSKIEKKDEQHPEKYCHICGNQAKTSFEKPRCYSCFKNSP